MAVFALKAAAALVVVAAAVAGGARAETLEEVMEEMVQMAGADNVLVEGDVYSYGEMFDVGVGSEEKPPWVKDAEDMALASFSAASSAFELAAPFVLPSYEERLQASVLCEAAFQDCAAQCGADGLTVQMPADCAVDADLHNVAISCQCVRPMMEVEAVSSFMMADLLEQVLGPILEEYNSGYAGVRQSALYATRPDLPPCDMDMKRDGMDMAPHHHDGLKAAESAIAFAIAFAMLTLVLVIVLSMCWCCGSTRIEVHEGYVPLLDPCMDDDDKEAANSERAPIKFVVNPLHGQ